MATKGFQPTLQHTVSAGRAIIEFGAGDYTVLTDQDGTDSGVQSHAIVTGLTYIAGGFVVSRDASDEIRIGCITSHMWTSSDSTWAGRWTEFTLDDSSAGIDYYMLFGW